MSTRVAAHLGLTYITDNYNDIIVICLSVEIGSVSHPKTVNHKAAEQRAKVHNPADTTYTHVVFSNSPTFAAICRPRNIATIQSIKFESMKCV